MPVPTMTTRRAGLAAVALTAIALTGCSAEETGTAASNAASEASTAATKAATAASSAASQAGTAASSAASQAAGSASAAATDASSAATSATDSASAGSYTLAQVGEHKTANDCWAAIKAPGESTTGVYDLTKWINEHPGGPARIQNLCGTDGTAAFTQMHGEQGASGAPEQRLASFKVGTLQG